MHLVETNNRDDQELLDELFRISGVRGFEPNEQEVQLVLSSLDHSDEEIRERAIFIGGLRWANAAMINQFKSKLLCIWESSDDLSRLMCECVVSDSLRINQSREGAIEFCRKVVSLYPAESRTAKAAYVGILRLKSKMTVQEFAALDYDEFHIPTN
jgi:hypothetical protein